MIAVFVDGPVRGSTRDIGHSGANFLVGVPNDDTVDRVIYHIHQFVLCNRGIRVASVHSGIDSINPDDVFEFIVSDLAKEAAINR